MTDTPTFGRYTSLTMHFSAVPASGGGTLRQS
jgi:hypothetical protein